jgi:hypothetical protein
MKNGRTGQSRREKEETNIGKKQRTEKSKVKPKTCDKKRRNIIKNGKEQLMER